MAQSGHRTVDTDTVEQAREGKLREISQRRSDDPRRYFNDLRQLGPVDFNENSQGSASVLNRADVEMVLRDPELFSSAIAIMGSAEPVIPVGIDPPLHSEYRRLLDPAFSPRRMAAVEPSVAAHTNRIIDQFIARGECNFSQDMAVPLPCSTFLDLLGVAQSELAQLIYWKDVMVGRAIRMTGSFAEAMQLMTDTAPVVYDYLYRLIAQRRLTPADDVISRLILTEIDGGRTMRDDEIARCLYQLIAAGLDTVTISLECIFAYLVEHPDARDMLVDDPSSTNNLVEELLRWDSPVQETAPRVATRDTEIAGCPIKAGTVLAPVVASANIDPSVLGADTVDVRRGDKRHLAFGGGPHRCLGSHLARMELRVVVREWHRRIPNYQLKQGSSIVWNASPLRGVDNLILEWDPSEVVGR
jgi:cytochrome P450